MTTRSRSGAAADAGYTPTEAKYKGRAEEMYVTYDLDQKTRGGGVATYPKVKRRYIAGEVNGWTVGDFEKKSGRKVHGVKIEYARTRDAHHRRGYTAERGGTEYRVPPTDVAETSFEVTEIVEVPEDAQNVRFRGTELPQRHSDALQDMR